MNAPTVVLDVGAVVTSMRIDGLNEDIDPPFIVPVTGQYVVGRNEDGKLVFTLLRSDTFNRNLGTMDFE